LERMIKTLPAVYENGVLRPLEPVDLKESQRVEITISDSVEDLADVWLDHEYIASVDAIEEAEPSLDEVRSALAKIPGKLSDDIRSERDSRG
jgi:predicted DNA-binding antitoxin AbrB/MazE fold protein